MFKRIDRLVLAATVSALAACSSGGGGGGGSAPAPATKTPTSTATASGDATGGKAPTIDPKATGSTTSGGGAGAVTAAPGAGGPSTCPDFVVDNLNGHVHLDQATQVPLVGQVNVSVDVDVTMKVEKAGNQGTLSFTYQNLQVSPALAQNAAASAIETALSTQNYTLADGGDCAVVHMVANNINGEQNQFDPPVPMLPNPKAGKAPQAATLKSNATYKAGKDTQSIGKAWPVNSTVSLGAANTYKFQFADASAQPTDDNLAYEGLFKEADITVDPAAQTFSQVIVTIPQVGSQPIQLTLTKGG